MSDRLMLRCNCGAKLAFPRSALGRKIRCPKCGNTRRAETTSADPERASFAPSAPSSNTGGASTQSANTIIRCACGANLRVPTGSRSRAIRCPKCGQRVHVAPAAPPPATQPAQPAVDDLDLAGIAGGPEVADLSGEIFPSSDESPVATAAPQSGSVGSGRVRCPNCAASNRTGETYCAACGHELNPASVEAGGGVSCPSCRRSLPKGAKICVDCGINIKTGRSLITTHEGDLDNVYVKTEGIIRIVSWIVWVCIVPVASEAFGTGKPYAVRAIAALTAAVSVLFWIATPADPAEAGAWLQLALWSGRTPTAAEIRKELTEAYREDLEESEELSEEDRGEIEAAVQRALASVGHFATYQLLTHAFLHVDIFHLIGNLIFLLVLGSRVNALIGNIWTAVLYPTLAALAALPHMCAMRDEQIGLLLGASGAVMGLVGMYLVLFPAHPIHMAAWFRLVPFLLLRLHATIFTVRGFWVVLAYVAIDVYGTLQEDSGGVANWAHLGGIGFGALIAVILLLTRRVNARGADIFSVLLGPKAWALVGRPGATR